MNNDPMSTLDAPAEGEAAVRPRRKGIYMLPNMFTLAALFGGFYAIVMAMNGRFEKRSSACSAPWCWTAWTAAWRA